MKDSKVPANLRRKLVETLVFLGGAAGGATGILVVNTPDPAAQVVAAQVPAEIFLAMEMGRHYESSGRHIGTPYVDRIGRGQPWTVCSGITGPEVVPGRYYSEAECFALELPRYMQSWRAAQRLFVHWGDYNIFVRASIIDMIFNVGEGAVASSTLRTLGNAGDVLGMCRQMPRWVYGTVGGVRVVQPGLIDRTGTREELCAEWGRSGHWTAAFVGVQ